MDINYVHSNPGHHGNNRGYHGNSGNGSSYRFGELSQPIPLPIPHNTDPYPFFLHGGGISRQVIQTDLPRYLGNNAQCKPGHDEHGRTGFWYKGYRQLTDAQIHTLREDSAKWKDERQQYPSQISGRDGPQYIDSRAFSNSHGNNGERPIGAHRRDPVPQPPITAVERPQYRYMPPPDNRPWYDNWSRQYIHPFCEPGTKSPVPPAQDQISRRVGDLSEPAAAPLLEGSGFAIPVDKTTDLPFRGDWTQDRDGGWLFRIAGDPNRPMQALHGRSNSEE